MFWRSLGVGSLINLASDVNRRRDVCLIQQESLVSLREALQRMLSKRGYVYKNRGDSDFENDSESGELANALDNFYFPEDSYEAVMQMQSDFYSRRSMVRDNLRRHLADLKDDFYSRHCLESRILPNGASELVLDENGKPHLIDGDETPEQKVLRMKLETVQHKELVKKHDEVRDAFTAKLRAKLIKFMSLNKVNLGVKKVSERLTELVAKAFKEAALLVEQQEEELWLLEIPEDEELQRAANEGLAAIREMNEREREAEDNSEAMQIMLNFERELTSYIAQCRYELRRNRYLDSDFLDPRSGLQARENLRFDLTEILPAHLVNCLSDLGIESEDIQ
ncbi:hypothetical protein IJT93_12295 [bacterium]|nr:hypothetical protein [bacterium]